MDDDSKGDAPFDLASLAEPPDGELEYDVGDLVARPCVAPLDFQTEAVEELYNTRRGEVAPSAELERILALPRRTPPEIGSVESLALVEFMTRRHAKPPGPCDCAARQKRADGKPVPCITRLREVQAWALHEIRQYGGVDGSIGVGHGKCGCASNYTLDYRTGRRRSVAEPGDLDVATFDRTLHIGPARAFASGRKACVRFVLADGSAAEFSTDHPVLTHRGWINAADLVPGSDFAAVASEMPEPTAPTQASDDEIAMVAYMLSDGGCSQPQATFTNMTPEIVADWQRLADTLCSGSTETPSKSRARQFRLLGARVFRDRWDLYGLAKEKRAHASLWGLPRRQVALFLNRFWACDGHVSKQGAEITLASEALLDDVRFLLLRLGIRSRKSNAPKWLGGMLFAAWRLSIYGAAAERFLAEVGDVLGKEKACHDLRMRLSRAKRNTNRDVVPIGRKELGEICDELGIRKTGVRAFFHATAGQFVSRARFVEFCHRHGYAGRYAHLATTDVAWERVASVEPIGDQDVYDLSVPGTHNFVANGIIVHNTLLDLVAPMALRGCRTAVLLVPANLVKQLIADYELLSNHWYLPTIYVHGRGETDRKFVGATPDGSDPPELHAISYNRLSRAEATTWLHDVKPDLIIADEADKLADLNTATVSRFIRYCLEHPSTRLVWWTGSPTDRSILEYVHLSQVALGEGSPVPRVFFPTAPDGGLALEQDIAMDWARAIDPPPNPGAKPAPPGPLMRMCEPGESLWEGFHRRLIETPGFIHTTTSSDDTPIRVIEREGIDVPLTIQIALDVLREDMARPDGWTFENPLETSACARQLACGFYYRWEYPRGESVALIEEWLATRKAFCGELRWKLKTDRREHMDSELLLKRAAARFYGDLPPDPSLPVWECRSWPAWRDIADKVVPTTVPQFLDDYLVRDAIEWSAENAGPIWYESSAFGEWIADTSAKGGSPLEIYGGRPDGEKRIAALVASGRRRPVILSLSSHGRGRNGLQHLFCTQLVAQPPSTPKRWEQMLGRLSRPGQTAAEVECHVYRHTEELDDAVTMACGRAAYVRGTMGADQKLLNGVERQRARTAVK